MASDGQVIIDLLFPGNKNDFKTDADWASNLIKGVGKGAGEQAQKDFNSNMNKVKSSAENAKNDANQKLDQIKKEVHTKLIASAEEAGIKNFRALLNELPKEEVTKLEAKAEKGETIDWREEMSKMPRSIVTKMKLDDKQATVGLQELKHEAKETGGSFSHLKEIITGSFVGQAIYNGIQSLVSGLKSAAQAGLEYNKEQDTMKTVWTSLTTQAPKDGKVLVDYINSLSQHSIYAAGTIDKMAQSFYHVHSNVQETEKWTQDFVALGSTLHMSNDQLSEAGELFSKMMASGKATSGDIQVMINRFPMFGEALQKVTGKSMSQIYQLTAQGKLSSKALEEALDSLGEKYKNSQQEAMTSFLGMSMYISSRWSVLWGDITKTSFNMSKKARGDIRDLLSDDMLKKYAASVSSVISQLTAWVTRLLDYINSHKNTIVDIIGNLKTLLGIIAQTVWKTFIQFIYDMASAFGLVSDKGKGAADPLKEINDILQALIDHKKGVEDITRALVAFFMVKKASDFLGVIKDIYSNLKGISGLSLGGSLFGGTSAPTKTAGTVEKAGAEETTLSRTATNAGKSGLLGSLGAGSELLTRDIPVLAGGFETVHALTSNKTVGGKVGGSAGAIGGTAAGAALGTAILPGIGTALGAGAGAWVGEKFGSGFGKSIQKSLNGHAITAHVKVKTDVDTSKINKAITPSLKKLNKQLMLKMSFDPKSISQTQKETNKLYSNMAKQVNSYYKNKEAKSKKDLDQLVKNGTITQKQADADYKKEVANDEKSRKAKLKNIQQMQNDTNKYYSQVEKIDNGGTKKLQQIAQKYGTNSKKYEEEKNKELQKAHKNFVNQYVKDEFNMNTQAQKDASNGAKEQKSIYNQLIKDKGKLSLQDLKATQKNADDEYNSAVSSARKTRNDVRSAAEDKYKSVKSTAEHEYKDTHTISYSQYKDIVKNAKDQRDDTYSAANDQYNKVTSKASQQHQKVTNEIQHQRDEVKNAAYKQADYHNAAAGQEMTDVNGQYSGGFKGTRDVINAFIGGFNDVLNALHKGWGKIPKLKSHALGSAGLLQDELALVGEEGFELAHDPQRGIYALGSNGPEIRHLKAGTSILPHEQSKKFLQMTSLIPHHAGGVIGTISKTYDWLKDKLKDVESLVSKGASSAVDWITDKVGLNSFLSKFNAAQYSMLKGTADLGIKDFKSYLGKFFKKYDDEYGDAGGSSANPGGSGVQRWKDDVKRALAANGLSTSEAMIAKVLRQIQTESGGNPNARQPGADPDGDGSGPALGLMQTKRSTFNANKFSGHGDIWNGYDNLLAALHYAKKAYGSSLYYLGNGHGYAFGGAGDQEGYYKLFEGNQKEFVVPNPSVTGIDRSYAVLGQAAAYLGAKGNVQSNNSSVLETAVNKLVALQSAANSKLEKSINKKVQVVLDTGKMVGAMYSKIDKQGYTANSYQQRNVWG